MCGSTLCHGDATRNSVAEHHIGRMTETTYRIIPQANNSYGVEVARPGVLPQRAAGFASEAEANAWIAQDKRLRDAADPWRPPVGQKWRGY